MSQFIIYYLYQRKLNQMQIKYFKQEIRVLKYLGQKNAMLEPCKMKHTQTLVVFRQIFQIGVDFIMKILDSLKISEFSLNT